MEKVVLFKVEVAEANIDKKSATYTVKRMSDEKELVQRFKELHGIKVK